MEWLVYLLVGTYTAAGSEGLYAYRFDEERGTAEYVSAAKVENPSYLTVTENGGKTCVYAVSENDEATSCLNMFTFDKAKGTFACIRSEKTEGGAPCYVVTDEACRLAVTANYGGGSLSIFPLSADGTPGKLSQLLRFEGRGSVKGRQDSPHLHCAAFSPEGKYLFATDLGTDRLYRFAVERIADSAYVREDSRQEYRTADGAGPRHFTFHPSGKFMYLVNELGGTVTAYAYADGVLQALETLVCDSLHAGGSADIHLSPDGRFLYASNRLQGDGLSCFAVDGQTGRLRPVGYRPTVRHPRNFAFTPNGRFLLVAGRDDDCIQIFRVDPTDGSLHPTGNDLTVSRPVCLKFVR
ncbi:MAG: lactonase family protein [Tannerellaceae bacterium]|jgi:6-phosphogluconolactonase (cycloisomerase 2 family)|nr:lactonase family protein [Tannerellaceae bacterium]